MTTEAPTVRAVRSARIASRADGGGCRDGAGRTRASALVEERPQLTVVDPRSYRARRRRRIGWAICGVLALAMPFVAVTVNASMAQAQFHLDQLHKDYDDAQQQYAELRARVAELSSPQRIVTSARQLGLQDPGRSQSTVLEVPMPTGSGGIAAPVDRSTLATSWGKSKTSLSDAP